MALNDFSHLIVFPQQVCPPETPGRVGCICMVRLPDLQACNDCLPYRKDRWELARSLTFLFSSCQSQHVRWRAHWLWHDTGSDHPFRQDHHRASCACLPRCSHNNAAIFDWLCSAFLTAFFPNIVLAPQTIFVHRTVGAPRLKPDRFVVRVISHVRYPCVPQERPTGRGRRGGRGSVSPARHRHASRRNHSGRNSVRKVLAPSLARHARP
jgi:hypothetical protein